MELQIPEVKEILSKIESLQKDVDELKQKITPKQSWYTLKEICNLKGLNYKTVCNNPKLKPNGGQEDGIVAGRKCWKSSTVERWLNQTDKDLEKIN